MFKSIALVVCLFFVANAEGRSHRRIQHLRTRPIFPANKIFGGNDTDIIDIPYTVQVGLRGRLVCGGSILSANFVLTGAECIQWYDVGELSVRYGTNEVNKGGTLILVSKIFVHPLWTIVISDFNVAVLQLAKPIRFSETAKPIALASKEPVAGDKALISGWGHLTFSGAVSNQLQSAVVTVIDRDQCNEVLFGEITEGMICAGDTDKGGCYGDDGGPLVTNGTQSGIIYFNYSECGDVAYPSVYSNVASLRSFIDEITGGEAQWV